MKDNKKEYLGGARPNQADLGLAPKLYHVEHAMREYKVRCTCSSNITDLMHTIALSDARCRVLVTCVC